MNKQSKIQTKTRAETILYPDVPILVSPALELALRDDGFTADTYRPAYSGGSVGLDLYNAGPTKTIPSASTNYKVSPDYPYRELHNDPVEAGNRFKKVFKQLIPTGLRVAIPHGWVGIIQERGSVTKTGLKVRAGIIDPGYTGEVFVNCVNLGVHDHEIPANTKLPFQLVVVQANAHFAPVSQEEYDLLTTESSRKEGKIGSSD